jgi:hypothetical protein
MMLIRHEAAHPTATPIASCTSGSGSARLRRSSSEDPTYYRPRLQQELQVHLDDRRPVVPRATDSPDLRGLADARFDWRARCKDWRALAKLGTSTS